jgi:PAS domain-containing protein
LIRLQVEEYSRALGTLISSMSYISSHFTGTTALSPLGLPLDVASSLKSNIKTCARTALPALDRVYQEAKSTAEERLSRNIYPEFVKYQLAQCLTGSLSTTRPLTGAIKTPYPGLGDAFCLTDPLRPDNPVVFASDGLLSLSGFQRGELLGKNCRLLQGIATDPEAVCRLSRAIAAGREATELLLNYRPDGTPYWNLLFICPLMENGIVRYLLGAQVNISENMGTDYRDVLGVLNFGRPPEDFHPPRAPPSPASTDCSTRQSTENLALSQTDDDKPSSRRRRFFRRFRRKSPSSRASSPSQQGSTASLPATDDSPRPPLPSPRCHPHPLLSSPRLDHHHYHNHDRPYRQHLDEHSTPYARLLILRYNPNPTSPPQSQPPSASTTTTPTKNSSSNKSPQLPIAFTTPAALALLHLRPHEAHAVLERDVFAVLAAQLGSPSVSRVLRREVVGAVGRGEGVVRDLVAPSLGVGAGGGAIGGGGGGGEGLVSGVGGAGAGAGSGVAVAGVGVRAGVKGSKSVVAAGTSAGGGAGAVYGEGGGAGDSRPRLSGTLDRGAEFFSHVLFTSSAAASGSGGKGQVRRVVSSGVPLKDGEGKVRWVVLVLTPVEGSG